MRKIILLVFALPFILLSCKDNARMAEQFHTLEDAKWHRFDKLNFSLNITDTKNDYDVKAVFTLNEQYMYDNLPIHVVMDMNGEERINELKMGFRDAEGNLLRGEKKEGKYVIEVPLFRSLRFNSEGACKFVVEQIIPKYDTYGIEKFGIVIDKTEKK